MQNNENLGKPMHDHPDIIIGLQSAVIVIMGIALLIVVLVSSNLLARQLVVIHLQQNTIHALQELLFDFPSHISSQSAIPTLSPRQKLEQQLEGHMRQE